MNTEDKSRSPLNVTKPYESPALTLLASAEETEALVGAGADGNPTPGLNANTIMLPS